METLISVYSSQTNDVTNKKKVITEEFHAEARIYYQHHNFTPIPY